MRAVVARQARTADVMVARPPLLHERVGSVRGSIVDDDPFPGNAELSETRFQSRPQRRKVLCFVIRRRDDAEHDALASPGDSDTSAVDHPCDAGNPRPSTGDPTSSCNAATTRSCLAPVIDANNGSSTTRSCASSLCASRPHVWSAQPGQSAPHDHVSRGYAASRCAFITPRRVAIPRSSRACMIERAGRYPEPGARQSSANCCAPRMAPKEASTSQVAQHFIVTPSQGRGGGARCPEAWRAGRGRSQPERR